MILDYEYFTRKIDFYPFHKTGIFNKADSENNQLGNFDSFINEESKIKKLTPLNSNKNVFKFKWILSIAIVHTIREIYRGVLNLEVHYAKL